MINVSVLTILILTLTPVLVFPQIEHRGRYEQEYSWRDESYLVISNDTEGVTLLQTSFEGSARELPLFIKQLDTDLKEVWNDSISISRNFFIKGYHYTDKKTYVLLQDTQLKRIKVLRLDHVEQDVREFESRKIVELDIQEFEVIKNTAVIGGYFDERPAVFAYDLLKNKVRTLQNVYQNNSELLEVRINNDSLTFNVLATTLDQKKDRTIIVNTYDYEGNAVRDYTLETKVDYQLMNAVSSSINDITQVVTGIYTFKTATSPSGIFVNFVDRTGAQKITYYNFGELRSFLDYQGEKRASKIKERMKAAKRSLKEYRYKTQPLFREMTEDEDHLVVLGEFFKPINAPGTNASRYSTLSRLNMLNTWYNPYDPNYFSSYQNQTPNDYDFTHAYVLVLDKKGGIQWDDYLKIDEDLEQELKEFGKFHWHKAHASYLYYKDEELIVKVLDGSGQTEEIRSALKLLDENDELKYEQENSLGTVRWYGDNFLIYGIQHIRPADRSQVTRKVFFINKVAVTDTPVASKLD